MTRAICLLRLGDASGCDVLTRDARELARGIATEIQAIMEAGNSD
jgi:hypothetical protein